MRVTPFLLVAAIVLAGGCNGETTSPTDTETDTAVAGPTVSEEFSGTLPVGGSTFYSFTTSANGTINATLTAVGGDYVPATVQVSLAIGRPSGIECTPSTSVTTAAGASPQVTGTYAPDVYCVSVADIGNLFAPATFSVTIDYP